MWQSGLNDLLSSTSSCYAKDLDQKMTKAVSLSWYVKFPSLGLNKAISSHIANLDIVNLFPSNEALLMTLSLCIFINNPINFATNTMSQEFFELMICPWQQIHNAKLSISGKSEHATGRTPNLMCYPVMLITGNKFINLYSISVSCYSRSSISMLICQSGGQPWVFFIDSRKHLANAISNIIFRPGFVNSSNENWCLFVWLYRDTWFLSLWCSTGRTNLR